MSEIISISERTWRIEEDGVRFFLLAGNQKALLVDSGMQTRNAKEIAQSLTDLPLELINTHLDRDHTGSNDVFSSIYVHPSECVNHSGKPYLPEEIKPVWDGDEIDLGGRKLLVIALPGHTPGSIALLDETERFLIGGDAIQDGAIFMFGPYRNLCAYCHSLDRLNRYLDRFDVIYPSHGNFPVTKDILPKLRKGAEAILQGELSFTEAEMFGNRIRVYDVGTAKFLCGNDEK